MKDWRMMLSVSLGGAIGANVRASLMTLVIANGSFPFATLMANVIGSFLLGVVSGFVTTRGKLPEWARLGITVGVCGGFTTMSTFARETMTFVLEERFWMACLYFMMSAILGISGAFLGYQLGSKRRMV